jgi:hypothetical protein
MKTTRQFSLIFTAAICFALIDTDAANAQKVPHPGASERVESFVSAQALAQLCVAYALEKAAAVTGIDHGYLVNTAGRESSFNPMAKARTSSAAGLFQFVEDTWFRLIDRYGASHGLVEEAAAIRIVSNRALVDERLRLQILALRYSPEISAYMAAKLAMENRTALQAKLGRMPTNAELYIAHFMGPTDAARLIKAALANTPGPAAALFPQVARANPWIFQISGHQLSTAEVYSKLLALPAFKLPDSDTAPRSELTLPAGPASVGVMEGCPRSA